MKKQRTLGQVARTIMAFYRDRRRMPTYSEMAALLDTRSKGIPQFWVTPSDGPGRTPLLRRGEAPAPGAADSPHYYNIGK